MTAAIRRSNNLTADLLTMGHAARAAATSLRDTTAALRTAAIREMARQIRIDADAILVANHADLAAAASRLTGPELDRLALDPARLEGLAAGVEAVADIADPVGQETSRWQRPNGLDFARVRTPIGVIAVIYESRPNVTADAAALTLRSGNAVILRGGSECLRTSLALHAAIVRALEIVGLPAATVSMVPTADREAVGLLLTGLGGTVDLLIPRGGKSLVARVQSEARVAVLGHLEGLNHVYVHAAADPDIARKVVVNSKMRRVSVCGSAETLLIDARVAPDLLPQIGADLAAAGCEMRGDGRARALLQGIEVAVEADWTTEYLAPIIAIRVVDGLDDAVTHIATHGSGHTDCIVTEDPAAAEAFTTRVDSAIVLVNASTQFADGGEFGFGAEIGIATDRLHARGPVGAEQLTSFKYVVRGTGQTRP
jgi:glutamate-5-semialdehyde dehydrogenase